MQDSGLNGNKIVIVRKYNIIKRPYLNNNFMLKANSPLKKIITHGPIN